MRTRRTGTLLLLALAIQIGLKLWLVHDHEVQACDYPADDPWYVIASTNWYWWGSYAEAAFIRSAAYPLWIALSRSAGLPLRLSTEFLFMSAAAAFVISLVRAGVPRAAAVVIFGLIVFHPVSIHVNDSAMSESLYAPLLLASVAGMVALLVRPRNRWTAVLTGLILGVLWQTRQETLLVLLQIALFAPIAAWVGAGEHTNVRSRPRDVGTPVLIMAAVAAGIALAVRLMNYTSFGVFADRQLDMPGFVAAQNALLRITPERRLRWVGVPQASLQRAYAVSPTLRLLQPYFDGPEGRRWQTLATAEQPEVGGRFGWALHAAIDWAGHGKSAADTEALCRRIAQEINAACTTGQLRCAPAFLGSLVLVGSWLSEVPRSIATVSNQLFWRGDAFEARCPTTPRSSIVEVFDFAANRRTALLTAVIHVAGWAVNFTDPVQSISFRDGDGGVRAFTDQLHARPDLDEAFRDRRVPQTAPLLAAFDLRIPVPLDHEVGGALIVTLRSGKTVAVDYRELRSMDLRHPFTAGADGSLEYAIEERHMVQEGRGRDNRAVTSLLQSYGYGVITLSVAGLASVFFLVSARARAANARRLLGVVLLLLGTTASRIAFLAVFDASAWPATELRFLYPVAYLYPCALVVLICCAVQGVMARVSQKPQEP